MKKNDIQISDIKWSVKTKEMGGNEKEKRTINSVVIYRVKYERFHKDLKKIISDKKAQLFLYANTNPIASYKI